MRLVRSRIIHRTDMLCIKHDNKRNGLIQSRYLKTIHRKRIAFCLCSREQTATDRLEPKTNNRYPMHQYVYTNAENPFMMIDCLRPIHSPM